MTLGDNRKALPSSLVPAVICHCEERSDAAISTRLNTRQRTAFATATGLPRYARNDKVGTYEVKIPLENPLPCSKRIIFECTVPLPSKKARTPKDPKPKIRVKNPNTSKKPRRSPTPLELQERLEKRREYDKKRDQRPERLQSARDNQKRQRQRRKELGKCKVCPQPVIPGQTRCPSCAAKQRQHNDNATAKRQAAKAAAQQI